MWEATYSCGHIYTAYTPMYSPSKCNHNNLDSLVAHLWNQGCCVHIHTGRSIPRVGVVYCLRVRQCVNTAHPDSEDKQLFPTMVIAFAPAVTMDGT